MNPHNGPPAENFNDWMRQGEKQSLRNTRRPRISHASHLMGPGLGPYAVEIRDWSDEITEFNGFFYSRPGAFNSPDPLKWWIGHSIAQVEGFGVQQVWDYRGVSSPPTVKTRRFSLVGSTRVFSAWA